MNELEEAFEDALSSAEEVKGKREKVTFRGRQLDALFSEQSVDPRFVGGGVANDDAMLISVRTREAILGGEGPIKLREPIKVRGNQLVILAHFPREGRMDLAVGDPAAED